MTEVTIRPATVHHYEMSNLRVEAELAGSRHEFEFDGRRCELKLPNLMPVPKGHMQDPDADMVVIAWHVADGQDIPTSCAVYGVELRVIADREYSFSEEFLSQGTKRFPPDNERGSLDELAEKHEGVAGRAFEYWVALMRWRTMNGEIARSGRSMAGYTGAIEDSGTGRRLYNAPVHLTGILHSDNGITAAQWADVQSALSGGLHMPVWFAFLFQGEHRLRLGDRPEAVVNFAIACEILIRTLYWQEVPCSDRVSDGAKEVIDSANVRAIITRWGKMKFWRATFTSLKSWQKTFDVSRLHALFDARNDIVHTGPSGVTAEECRAYATVARNFVIAADRLVQQV